MEALGNARKRKLDTASSRSKVLKETKNIPPMIFNIEQYEKTLIALSAKSKVSINNAISYTPYCSKNNISAFF